MDAKKREKWTEKQKEDELRHANQLAELEKKGFFTNVDGTKSTDEKPQSNSAKQLKKKYGDVLLPKRPCSGYIFFTTNNINRVK
tara:strand:- start:129 stop:380 length:252 start_codon:yes stop_codon:yes gene_type:complete